MTPYRKQQLIALPHHVRALVAEYLSDALNDAYAEGRADALAALDAQEVCTLIRRMPLGFADLLAMVSAIECRLVEKGDRENVATEDAAVRLCQAIDELGQLKDRTDEEVKQFTLGFYTELAAEARREAA